MQSLFGKFSNLPDYHTNGHCLYLAITPGGSWGYPYNIIKIPPYKLPTQPRKGWPHHQLSPLLFPNDRVGSFTSHNNQVRESGMGLTVFHPYPRRQESLTVSRCHYKGSTFFSVSQRHWSFGPAGFEPANSCSADQHSPNNYWALSN